MSRSKWSHHKAHADLLSYVFDFIEADGDDYLLIDETAFPKKGTKSAGVSRQYCGSTGKKENCQVGVFMAYVTAKGETLIDRELYLPKQWTDDPQRCQQAGVPQERTFLTKPQLATMMLERMRKTRQAAWVSADCVYGNSKAFCHKLELMRQQYTVGVTINRTFQRKDGSKLQLQKCLDSLSSEDWLWLDLGQGSKGAYEDKWFSVDLEDPEDEAFERKVLFRKRSDDVRLYVVYCRKGCSLERMARSVHVRWKIEECFRIAKQRCGLKDYELRNWQGWYRHTILSLCALAFLKKLQFLHILKEKKTPPNPVKGSLNDFRKSRGLASFPSQPQN